MEKTLLSTDEELFDAIKSGNLVAFKTLYDRYWHLLYAVVVSFTKSADDAEDVLQDCFSYLWRKRAGLEVTQSVKGYLITCAKNKALLFLSKQVKRLNLIESVEEFGSHPETEYGHSSNGIEFSQLKKQLDKEINELPARTQKIYRLSREANLSHKEISIELGISERTVKNKVSFALKILRFKLNDFLML